MAIVKVTPLQPQNRGLLIKSWILVWAVTAAGLIFACSPADDKAVVFAVGGAPSEVSFWEDLLREFQRQTGVRVELLRQPAATDQRRQGLVIALNARQSNPDVFLMDVAWLGLFSASHWLEPLENDVDAAPFFQRVINLVDRQQGHLIALPVYLDCGILYYRRDLLQRFRLPGPPNTWKELLSQALAAFIPGAGRSARNAQNQSALLRLRLAGGPVRGACLQFHGIQRVQGRIYRAERQTAAGCCRQPDSACLYAGSDPAISNFTAEHVHRDEGRAGASLFSGRRCAV